MKTTWISNYREVQRRAEYRWRDITQELKRKKWISRQQLKITEFKNFDQGKIQQQLQNFYQHQRQTFKHVTASSIRFIRNTTHFSTHRTNLNSRILRNRFYQKIESWWEYSPCPATVALLTINSLIFFLW